MLLVSIGLWFVVVFSLRVTLWGNPLYNLLLQTDPSVLKGAEEVTLQKREPMADQEIDFLRRFSRLTLLEMGAFVLGIGLLVYLWASDVLVWLTMTLLIKDLCMVALSAAMARARSKDTLFASLVDLPPWLILTDRLSSLISAAGFLILFLFVNNIKW